MMFREIRTFEKITDTIEEPKNYLNIKPENEMSEAEVDDFWNTEFRKIWNESNDKGQE